MCRCPGCDEMSCGLPDCDECEADKMAKSAPEPGEQGGGEGQADSPLDQRVSNLEAGQESLSGKIDRVLDIISGGGGHADDPTATADEPGAPDIAHQIRAQLDKRDAEQAAKTADDERNSTLADLKAKVAELTEKTPEPLPRRVERIMGWH